MGGWVPLIEWGENWSDVLGTQKGEVLLFRYIAPETGPTLEWCKC
jgi:hypothetical protein